MKTRAILTSICIVMLAFNSVLGQDFEPIVQKAKEYYDAEKYDSAAVLFEAALPLIEKEYGANDTGYYAKQLSYTAESFDYIEQYEKEEQYLLILKSIYENLGVTVDKEYALILNNLGTVYTIIERYSSALPFLEEAKKIRQEILGDRHPDYAESLNALAYFQYCLGNYETALPLFEESISIRREVFGNESFEYAETLSLMVLLHYQMGNYEVSLPLALEVINIRKKISGSNDPEYLMSLNILAMIYYEMGNYEDALIITSKVCKLGKEILGAKNQTIAIYLTNLAALNEATGNYETSLASYEEAIDIYKENLGVEKSGYATTMNNLAMLYMGLGNYEDALPLFEESSKIYKEILGPQNESYALSLCNLAYANGKLGNYESAITLVLESKRIRYEIFGPEHPYYAKSLGILASIYQSIGHFQLALPLLVEAISIYKNTLGIKHPDYALLINKLAALYLAMGNYEAALPLFDEAKSIRKEILGDKHPKYISTLNSLATLYNQMGNYIAALPLYEEANISMNQNVQDYFSFLSKFEKKKYLTTVSNNYETYLSFMMKVYTSYPDYCSYIYNNELMRKGLILNSVTATQQVILESGDTSLTIKYEKLRVLNRLITSQLQKPIDERSGDLDSLQQKVIDMERGLTRSSQIFGIMYYSFNIIWEDIRDRLIEDESAIEFTSFRYYDANRLTDSTYYCALILRKTDTLPQFVFLCEEKQLKDAIPPSGANFKTINPFYQDNTLHNLIWKPLDSLLQGIQTVYFAPSGLLNSVAMAAIQCPDGKVLSEKYNLVQLSSTRTLAMPEEPVAITDAVIYGGIKYETDTTDWLTSAGKYKKEDSDVLAYNPPTFRGITRGGWAYLPGTKKEAELISEKLGRKGIDTTTFTGMNTLEESFYALSGNASPSVIHISTHGFYYPDTVSDEYRKNMMNSASGDIQFKYADDPLLRSGLLMAGGNNTWKGQPRPEGLEDGILTAREVSNMNLLNTELVVLSACQTGQGDVKGSEGVEGLQRGFKMAGVHYLIMSLWMMPDKETTEFMDHFYSLWPDGDLSIREAFRETQLKMKRKYSNEPHKWAGFVLME